MLQVRPVVEPQLGRSQQRNTARLEYVHSTSMRSGRAPATAETGLRRTAVRPGRGQAPLVAAQTGRLPGVSTIGSFGHGAAAMPGNLGACRVTAGNGGADTRAAASLVARRCGS